MDKSNRRWILIWTVFFCVVATVLWVSISSEQRTESGEMVENVSTKSITCEGDAVAYPFFEFDESERKNLKILAVLDEDKLKTISLQYMLYYTDAELVDRSEGVNHAAINSLFAEKGLGVDAINANYARLSDGLRFSLYQTGDEMEESEKEFFLLDGVERYDASSLAQKYNEIGLDCKIVK